MAATVSPQGYVVNPRTPRGRANVPARPKHALLDTLALASTFLLIGLLLGASIGWVLFPIEAQTLIASVTPSKNTPSREQVIAVADKYWHTLDAVDAQSQLSSYDADDLAAVLASVLQDTKSSETRLEVAGLAQALDLYPSNPSVLDLLGSPFILALLVALVPIALGVWLVLIPAVRERKAEQKRLEEETAAALRGEGLAGTGAGSAVNAEGLTEAEAAQLNGEPGEGAAEMAQAPAAEPGEAAALPPLQAVQTEETEEEAEEHAAEEKEILKDLANLFEEEDTSLSALEAMVKNLAEITIADLGAKAQNIVLAFRNAAWGD